MRSLESEIVRLKADLVIANERNERLLTKLEIAREKLAQLEHEITAGWRAPIEWHLTDKQEQIVGLIVANPVAYKSLIMTKLYLHASDEPNQKIIDVYICKIRKKVEPHGIKINTMYGRGYYASKEDRKKLLELSVSPQ